MAGQKNHDEEIKTMYENFRQLRRAHAWTIEELSKISGIKVKTLHNMEEDKNFNIVYLLQLCELYGVAVTAGIQ